MVDRVPMYPGRVKLTPVAGQINTYDMAMADSPTVEGTPLNKSNLLSDATAAAINQLAGTTPDVPNDALRLLTAALTATNTTVETRAKIQTGSYVGTGTYGADNPCSLTFDFQPKIILMLGTSGNLSAAVYPKYIFGYDYSSARVFAMNTAVLSETYSPSLGFCLSTPSESFGKKSTDGKTIFWYHTGHADAQVNSAYIWYWLALG